jgi:NDP-sugar pyrophosphorylase family protein
VDYLLENREALMLIAETVEVSLLDYLSRASIIVFLILVIFGVDRGWWYTRGRYRDLEQRHEALKERYEKKEADAEAWKETALRAGVIAQRTTTVAEAAIQRGVEVQDRSDRRSDRGR